MSDLIEQVKQALIPVCGGGAGPEQCVELLDRCSALTALARDLKRQAEEAIVDHIVTTGEFVYADKRYYAANKTETKVRGKHSEIREALLEAAFGDEQALDNCLSSNAWKPAAVRDLLGKDSRFIEQTTKPVLKEGKPRKSLKTVPVNGFPSGRTLDNSGRGAETTAGGSVGAARDVEGRQPAEPSEPVPDKAPVQPSDMVTDQ
jgi:hypothetical protein